MKTKVLGLIAVCTIVAASFGAPMTSEAATLIYDATLSGAAEVPANASTGTGAAIITIDDVASTMSVVMTFNGLSAAVSASLIHCCAPVGINTIVATSLPGFPATTAGTYFNTLDMTSLANYTAGFLTANGGTAASAFTALLTGLAADDAYINIHDSVFPGGEIRGQLVPASTPLPAALPLFATGLGALGLLGWRRKRKALAA
jgi:hypothetical protein